MSRAVVPVRLSDAERDQIASAAMRQGLSFSGFLRQAALQASAVIEGKVTPAKAPEPKRQPEPAAVPLEPEPAPHYVDGEPIWHVVEGVRVDAAGRACS